MLHLFSVATKMANDGSTLDSWLLLHVLLLALSAPGLFGQYDFSAGDPFEGHKWVPPSTVSHVQTVSGLNLFLSICKCEQLFAP